MLTFDTSYSYDRISLKVSGNELLLKRVPFALQKFPLMIILSDENDKELKRITAEKPCSSKINFGNLDDGIYYINLYTKTRPDSDYYWSYLQNRSLSIRCINNRLHFIVANVINANRKILSDIRVNTDTLNEFLILE